MAQPEHEIRYTVGGTAAAKAASLGTDPAGPLEAAETHILAKLTGARPTGGSFSTSMRLMEFLTFAKLVFDEAVDNSTEYWHIKPDRLSRFFRDLDQAGMPKDYVGDYNKVRALFNIWIPKLTDAQRLVVLADVYLDTAPGGESWVRLCTPLRVRRTDYDNEVFVELRMMLPGIWVSSGRSHASYTDQVKDIIAERVNVDDTNERRQAAAVIQWLRDTRVVPSSLATFYRADDATEEMQRRLHDEEEGRFRPLFEAGWTQGYPLLKKLFDEKTQGSTVATNLKSIMSRVGMPNAITDDAVKTFCANAKQKLELLNVPSLEGETDVDVANAARETALITALGVRGGTTMTGDGSTVSKDKDGSVDALMSSSDFQELLRTMDAHSTQPINLKDAAKELMRSKSAVGIMLVAGARVDIPQFKNFRGLAIKTNHIPATSVFQDALRVDKSGTAHSDWDWTLDKALTEKFILGRVAFGTASDKIDWWAELQTLIKLRETSDYVNHINSKAKISMPTMVFLSVEHLKLLLEPMSAVFATLGYKGTDPGCFDTVWRHFISRTEEFIKIPNSHPEKMALEILHVQACRLVFEYFAQDFQSMHAQPIGLAVKQPKFLAAGPAFDAWKRAGDVMAGIQQQLRTSNGALSKGQVLRLDSVKDRVNNVPDHLSASADAKVVFAWYGHNVPKRGRDGEDDRDGKQPKGGWKQEGNEFPKGSKISEDWGALAWRHGVWVSKDYDHIWFGSDRCITVKTANKPTPKCCLANYFGAKSKDRWCTSPKECVKHEWIDEADIETKWNVDRPEDAIEVVKPAVSTKAGDKDGGKGGKGKGKGGKGKGKGKGKGGKGKGKGKGDKDF